MKFKHRHRPLFSAPIPASVRKPQVKWKVWPIFWLAFKRMCFVLGLSVFVSAMIGVYFASRFDHVAAVPSLPKEMVLYIDLDEALREQPREASLADPFLMPEPTLRELVDTLDHAAMDDRVKGLYVRMREADHSFAHLQELRAAVERFKASGKFTKIYATSYGGASGGLGRFYLASAFDERWMQPLGVVSIAGVRAELPYVRSVLDKIGVEPNFYQRKEYKTAYESFIHHEMTPQNRESLQGIVDGVRDVVLADIPADLGFSPQGFETLMHQGLFTADAALEEELITHADYVDVLMQQIKEDVLGEGVPEDDFSLFVPAQEYYATIADGYVFKPHKPRVALIYAVGAIMDSAVNSGIAAADEIAPAIMEAALDETIEAIVLRIDSPGGSPAASETILHAIQRAQDKGKKVIVSMGPVAASGGYWIASSADQIFASPTTITGSIGVLGGKISLEQLWENIGVHWDKSVQWGENAGMWSPNTPFSESEAARINAMLDNVYEAFLERVSKGRGMSVEEVDKIAGGRVWSGVRAQELGLVDQLGGLRETMDYMAKLLGKQDQYDLNIVQLPRPKTPWEQLFERLSGGDLFNGFQSILSFWEQISSSLALAHNESVLVYEPQPQF